MRLKSTHASVTNQRIKRTCVGTIFMLCLLSSQVWSYANIKKHRFVRQLNAETKTETETAVNYEDMAMTGFYHQPHFTENRAVVVQLFEWKFVDVAEECRNFLGPQGYAGVQLSPVLEHTVIKSSELNHPWWERYEVMSYRLASRSGSESEFWSMSRICNEHGVRIYADVILNHMAAPLHLINATALDNEDFMVNTLLETNVSISQLNYPYVSYTQQDFHRPLCIILANAQDAYEIRNCQLNGHPDLDHSRNNVQKHMVEMLNKFIDMGVAGFRIDTAKHIWPMDLKNIFKQVKNLSTEFNFKKDSRPFVYYDVFDLGLDTISKTEYSTYGVVSEYLYSAELATIFGGKVPLSSLINWGPALGFLPPEDALVFIDSPDTQRGLPAALGNNHMLTYKERIKYIMANVFMLVHPYGALKRIMSSYYFPDTNINQGPPVEEADDEEIRSPKFNEQNQCTKESGWVCEHRWPELVRMLKVVNYFKVPENKEETVIHFQTNGPNQVAFCRGDKAFVAINNDPENDFVKEVYACLEPGIYCDVVTGGKLEGKEKCHGKMLEINAQGYTKLQLVVADDTSGDDKEEEESARIDSYGILVIYVETKIQPKENQLTTKETDEQAKEEKEEEKNAEATELNDTKTDSKESPNLNEDNEVDENELKENKEQEITDDKNSDQNNEGNNEDTGNPTEIEEDIVSEQPKEEDTETLLEQAEEDEGGEGEKLETTENNLEETTDKPEEEKLSSQEKKDHETLEENNENLNETEKENKAERRSIENVKPTKDIEKNENGEKNIEEPQANFSNEKEEQEEPEAQAEINLVEIKPENTVEEPEIKQETAKEIVENQSKNMDKRNIEAAKQIEKPSAEIVEDIEASDAVTAKIQDIQTAGIFSNSAGDGNSG